MASSPWRRATSIRAASRITAAPTTTRLTNRSRSTVSTAAWVPRNRARSCSSGELTVSASAAGASAPVSVGVTAVARFSELYSPCTWSAFMPPALSGNSSCSARPVPPNAPWNAPNWSGSAMTPPAQKSGELGLACSSAGFTGVASCRQKVDPAWRGRTMAVTNSVTGPDGAASVSRLPGCIPNRAAVCVVAATPTAPGGTRPPLNVPATSRAKPVNEVR